MEISRRHENGIPVLGLTGRLNQASADDLHTAAMEFAGDEDCKSLIIDMGGVDFIASVGIRSLIRPSQALAMRGGSGRTVGWWWRSRRGGRRRERSVGSAGS